MINYNICVCVCGGGGSEDEGDEGESLRIAAARNDSCAVHAKPNRRGWALEEVECLALLVLRERVGRQHIQILFLAARRLHHRGVHTLHPGR